MIKPNKDRYTLYIIIETLTRLPLMFYHSYLLTAFSYDREHSI